MRDCTQLTQEEGYQIEAFLQAGHPQSGIATVLKRDKSTISREVSRSPVLVTLAERKTRCSVIAKASRQVSPSRHGRPAHSTATSCRPCPHAHL